MPPAASSTPFRDSDLIIVRGTLEPTRPRGGPRQLPSAPQPLPAPRSGRSITPTEGGLSVTLFLLLLLLIWALWQWQETSQAAQSAREDASLSWNFADAALDKLQDARSENNALDTSRRDLIRALQQTQETGEALKTRLSEWKQAHTELAAVSRQNVEQWSSYSQQLEHNLGSTRAALTDTSTHLERERATAQQQLTQLDSAKTAIEREADAYARKAQSLEQQAGELDRQTRTLSSDKQQLENELSRLRGCLSDLERRNACLLNDNAALAIRNSHLCNDINCLQNRLSSLESKANSHDHDRDQDHDRR